MQRGAGGSRSLGAGGSSVTLPEGEERVALRQAAAGGRCGTGRAGLQLPLLVSPLCPAPWGPSALSCRPLALKGLHNQGMLVASPSTIPGACGCPVLDSSRESVLSPLAWGSTPFPALGSCCFLKPSRF